MAVLCGGTIRADCIRQATNQSPPDRRFPLATYILEPLYRGSRLHGAYETVYTPTNRRATFSRAQIASLISLRWFVRLALECQTRLVVGSHWASLFLPSRRGRP
jgi:hypothetical protein